MFINSINNNNNSSSTNLKQAITSSHKLFNSPNNQTWTYSSSVTPLLSPVNPKSSVLIEEDLTVMGTIYNPSDIRLKENIENIDSTLMDHLLKLDPKQYSYINDSEHKIHYGVIANELEEHFPHLVNETEYKHMNLEKIKTVNYLGLIPIMLMKIKDLQDQIDNLTKENLIKNNS